MKKRFISLLIIIATISFTNFSCGPSKEEIAKLDADKQKQREDSVRADELKFDEYYNTTVKRTKDILEKDGEFFIDYASGTIKVPDGYVWRLGKYNVWARKWDTVKINDQDIIDACDRTRLSGDRKPLAVGEDGLCIDVNKIIINGVPLTIPAAPCADKAVESYNTMTGVNNNWNRLAIGNVYLPPGTSICVPSNRFDRETGAHGLLTITQFKIKDYDHLKNLETIVAERNRRYPDRVYPTWTLGDKATHDKLNLIGELSGKLDWYKPF